MFHEKRLVPRRGNSTSDGLISADLFVFSYIFLVGEWHLHPPHLLQLFPMQRNIHWEPSIVGNTGIAVAPSLMQVSGTTLAKPSEPSVPEIVTNRRATQSNTTRQGHRYERSKDATNVAPRLTTRSKDAPRGSWPYY